MKKKRETTRVAVLSERDGVEVEEEEQIMKIGFLDFGFLFLLLSSKKMRESLVIVMVNYRTKCLEIVYFFPLFKKYCAT